MRMGGLLLIGLALASGCSTGITLTSAGAGVEHIQAADTPVGCNLLGDVAIGIPPDAARPRTEETMITLMRNKAGEQGATHVVVESSESRRTEGEAEAHWVGRGIAYACDEDAPSSRAPVEDRGAGGEETEEGASGGDEEDTEEDTEEDALDGL